jgi:hypothetical protein
LIVADVNEMSLKSVNATVPVVAGLTLVNVPPPATYVPEFGTSLVELYVVVVEFSVAALE